jgi:hypothetical protein
MNRRSFLTALGIGVTAATLDPEKLLWIPGKKTIFIPPAKVPEIAKLVVGFANGSIKAGNYGYVQVWGPVGGKTLDGPRLYRRVLALKDIWAGDLVNTDMVDAGNAPLWTGVGPDVMDMRTFMTDVQ